MNAKWLIENFSSDNSHKELIEAVRSAGLECETLDLTNLYTFDASRFGTECVVFNGSIQMAKTVSDALPNCAPVVWNTRSKYLCTTYYPVFGELLFNGNYAMLPACELRRQKWKYYDMFGKECMIFTRPNCGEKSFSGQLVDLQDFDRFWDNKVSNSCKGSDLVVVSTPKTIRGEWRFVVTKYGRKIIATSTYQYQGQRTLIPSAPRGATDKCREILSFDWHPDSVYCIDIAEDYDGTFWLLELTSFSSAGLYACNKHHVVRDVSSIAKDEFAAFINL